MGADRRRKPVRWQQLVGHRQHDELGGQRRIERWGGKLEREQRVRERRFEHELVRHVQFDDLARDSDARPDAMSGQ